MKRIFTLAAVFFMGICTWGQAGALNSLFNGGTVNTSFDPSGAQAEDLIIQRDGKVVVAGLAYDAGIPHFAIARYQVNGALDVSFGNNGKIITLIQTGCWAHAIALQTDGKIIVGGMTENAGTPAFAMARFMENGSLDNTFGNNGIVITSFGTIPSEIYDLSLMTDGRIVAGGRAYNGSDFDFALARYLPDGTPDVSFSGGQLVFPVGPGNDFAQSVKVQRDGKILVAGTAFNGLNHNMAVTRFTVEGEPDVLFGVGGKVITAVGSTESFGFDIALQSDGKIVFTGHTYNSLPYQIDVALVRYTSAGVPDPSFGVNGIVVTDVANTNDDGVGVALQNDGKIVVGGHTTNEGFKDFLLLRYLPNGTPDPHFGSNGISTSAIGNYDDIAFAVKLSGFNIYVAGISNTTPLGVPGEFAIASFINDAAPLPVHLLTFSAEKNGNEILLAWRTENENQLKEFIIERSRDGRNFEMIDRVTAAGNEGKNQYQARDYHPLHGTGYYRLRQMDWDGTFSFSRIVAIRSDASTGLEIFPNPATTTLNIQLPAGIQGNVVFEITGMSGAINHKTSLVVNGNITSATIDISSLPNGIYILNTRSGDNRLSRKFVKNQF